MRAFLYDLLGATPLAGAQDRSPRSSLQTDIDEVIIGHTNEPEFKKLQSNEFMEALRDRTVRIDIPYITKLADEVKIYEKDFHNPERIRGKHIAPHTLEMAAMWAVLTRLEEPKKHNLTVLQKPSELYNGKTLPHFTEDKYQGAAQGGPDGEGMEGSLTALHPGQDLQRAGVGQGRGLHQPLAGLRERARGQAAPLLADPERGGPQSAAATYAGDRRSLGYEDVVKNEVQRALSRPTRTPSRQALRQPTTS